MSKKRIELLAPAGGVEQLIAAVENGADAVYLGGRSFNARMNAGNFDDDTMQRAIDFAHRRGILVHVTMNTLLADDELEQALQYAGFLYQAGADALIIQDLGLASLVRQYMPDFHLHFSTQGTVYDLRGVEAASRLGFERVVLSRELSIKEIREICSKTDTEIEVFCHGALCVCYSGQCQLSRYFGGRSGNRGSCAQPCRLPYRTVKSGKQGFVQGLPYPLSPRDLCLIDHLGELIQAGVTSLKIEGRMKSPEYVGVVTSIYRKYLNRYYEEGAYQVTEADRESLEQVFNRGGFTDVYYRGESGSVLMAGQIPKHQGIPIGRVLGRIEGGDLLDIELDSGKELLMGDGVEIRGRSVSGNIVTFLSEVNGQQGKRRSRRGKDNRQQGKSKEKKDHSKILRIGDIRGNIEPGDLVFRISSKAQMDAVRRTYQGINLLDGGPREGRKLAIDMRVIGTSDLLTLTASAKILRNGKRRTITGTAQMEYGEAVFEETEFGRACDSVSIDGGLSTQRLEKALRKTGGTPFRVRSVRIEGTAEDGSGRSMRSSEMNDLRRRTLEDLSKKLAWRREKPFLFYAAFPEVEKEVRVIEHYYYDLESFLADKKFEKWGRFREVNHVALLPVRDWMAYREEMHRSQQSSREDYEGSETDYPSDELNHELWVGKQVIPYISNVTRGVEERYIGEHFEQIADLCRDSGIYIGTLSWIAPFRSAGVPVYGDYGLNVFNGQARAALEMLGVKRCADSLELMSRENGCWPLMTLEHQPEGSELVNEGHPALRVLHSGCRDQSVIIASLGTKCDSPIGRMDEDGDLSPARLADCIISKDGIYRIYHWTHE